VTALLLKLQHEFTCSSCANLTQELSNNAPNTGMELNKQVNWLHWLVSFQQEHVNIILQIRTIDNHFPPFFFFREKPK